jgi:signal transduction histidine kinase
MKTKPRNPKSLSMWIWMSYLKTALVPLVLVEVIVVVVYFVSNSWIKNEMSDYVTESVDIQMQNVSVIGSSIIQHQLSDVSVNARLYARQVEEALEGHAVMNPEDDARLVYSPDGAYYTAADNGGAAVYYPGAAAYGEDGRNKVANLLGKQGLMADFIETNPIITSICFWSNDSLHMIYPYVDVTRLYNPDNNVTLHDFYAEGDAEHNPSRGIVWTDVFEDPLGSGLMTSCLMPVYKGGYLEGVAGIDVSVFDMTKLVMQMPVPYGGYSVLTADDGTVLYLPEMARADWGLTQDTNEQYSNLPETALPDGLNMNDIAEVRELAQAVASEPTGIKKFSMNGNEKVVSWSAVAVNGWKLLMIVPEENIYANVDRVSGNMINIGITMIRVLIILFVLFIHILYIRARRMSGNLSRPLLELNELVEKIGQGQYYQMASNHEVKEFRDTSENLVSMGKSLGDINADLLATQAELKEKESYLQAIINSVDDFIVEVNNDGTSYKVITSTPLNLSENCRGPDTSLSEAVDEELRDVFRKSFRKVIKTGESESLEYQLETARGLRWFHARVTKIDGEADKVVVSARDITERKALENSLLKSRDEAEAANRAKTQFLSSMSHELRTPLNAVLGFAQVLEMDPAAPLTGIQKDCVYEIIKAGNHLLDLINEILDLAKIEAGKVSLDIEPVNIGTLMEETVTLIVPTAKKYGIKIETDMSYGGMFIMADKTRLKQVLLNLLSNAVKYNKPDGEVHFFCDEEDSKIRFHVADTGIGISEEDIRLIYKPFHRLKSKEKIVEGTGVGLTVAKHLVTMMGGEIHVESKLGVGSHFFIELPLSARLDGWEADTVQSIRTCAQFNAVEKVRRVLYIEDNEANLKLVERMVRLLPNTEFYSSDDAEKGIVIAFGKKPDVILLDINLPGMNGFEAFKEFRENPKTKNIPIIAVSSNAMRQDIDRALDMGFDDYVTKPIHGQQFIEKLRNYLDS